MKFIKAFIRSTDLLSKATGIFFASLTAVLVLLVCYDVLTRYLFRYSSVGVQEFEWHLFAMIFLGAAAYTLLKDEHVRVDVIYSKFSERTKAWINFSGSIIFLIPFCIIIIYTSTDFVTASFEMMERSPDAGGLPARFLLKGFIPFSFFLILVQGISQALKTLLDILNKSGYKFEDQSEKETVL